ncbi:hypothetical protein KUCAC02_029253 [Chaenocephalus aceratus]|uniref:Uncharacterized protein n=1 Tax=Chaenocephalus aceratus TaxID=36190 RepID=A0ACB9X619_CHAAC|nr:hypothetical protein KUCAC02_029253 [Chaenocephalus aceratus]
MVQIPRYINVEETGCIGMTATFRCQLRPPHTEMSKERIPTSPHGHRGKGEASPWMGGEGPLVYVSISSVKPPLARRKKGTTNLYPRVTWATFYPRDRPPKALSTGWNFEGQTTFTTQYLQYSDSDMSQDLLSLEMFNDCPLQAKVLRFLVIHSPVWIRLPLRKQISLFNSDYIHGY